jgi:hypothetical protein
MTLLFVEFLLRNLLSVSPDHTPFALLLPPCDLAANDVPALSFAVLAEAPFLELPLVLALAVAVLVTWVSSSFSAKRDRTSSQTRGTLSFQ